MFIELHYSFYIFNWPNIESLGIGDCAITIDSVAMITDRLMYLCEHRLTFTIPLFSYCRYLRVDDVNDDNHQLPDRLIQSASFNSTHQCSDWVFLKYTLMFHSLIQLTDSTAITLIEAKSNLIIINKSRRIIDSKSVVNPTSIIERYYRNEGNVKHMYKLMLCWSVIGFSLEEIE